eukprot:TRINITY_DN62599_c0_g1_i1.p1 TRINITY_DN62599_c0_g1~~TRINITY_DN62599_c0_g1_i1.p1  ORF type:complete len:499 (-),score=101.06 TRINITY_DN62599_c0_g1_i1:227-1618(-)
MTTKTRNAHESSTTYSFSSQPKAVAAARTKYREPGEPVDTGVYRDLKETSIMWDKRVHRGNTHGLYTQNAIKEAMQDVMGASAPEPRRKRKPVEKSLFDMPLPERERIPVDLSKHLVAKEEVIVVATAEAQTDEFLPEPPEEHYQPRKTGIDVSTQVEDGELFDFNYEVEPILDVLINKTIEQSLMETEEEDELERMKEFKEQWYLRQEAMMKDWDAQVAEEWVRWRIKEEVVARKREEKKREARLLLKIQAMSAAKHHSIGLVPNAVRDLKEVAFPDMKGLARSRIFMPELIAQVHRRVEGQADATQNVDQMVASSVETQVAAQRQGYSSHQERSKELRKYKFEQLQIRRGKIRLRVDGFGFDSRGGPVVVGPIQISVEDTLEEIEERVCTWLGEHQPGLEQAIPWGIIVAVNGEAARSTEELFASSPGQISISPKPEPAQSEENEEDEDDGDAEEGVEGDV